MNRFSLPDRKFFGLVAGSAVLLAALPFLIGWRLTPTGHEFQWNSWLLPNDPSVYYAYIEQGRQGQVMMSDVFTSEPLRPVLWQPVWWLVGQAANIFRLATPIAFTLARWGAIPLLLYTVWWAARWLWPDRLRPRLAVLLAGFGGGLGGLVTAMAPNWVDHSQRAAPDLWVSEAFPALSAMSSVHFLLVTAGLLYTIVSIERASQEGSWRRVLGAGVVLLLTLSIHPQHVVTLLLIWIGTTVVRWWQTKSFPASYIGRWTAALFLATPALWLYTLQLWFDPLVAGRAAQNINLMTSPVRTLVGLGGFFIVPLAGLIKKGQDHKHYQWLWPWALAALAAAYFPAIWQRRLSQGLIIPWALLTAPLLAGWLGRIATPAKKMATLCFGGTLLLFSPWLVVAANVTQYQAASRGQDPDRHYLSSEYLGLISYLRLNTKVNEIILTERGNGLLLAGRTGRQVYLAQGVETLNYRQKSGQVRNFFQRMTTNQQRQFIARENICYILDSPYERAIGPAWPPADRPEAKIAWSGPTIRLYAVGRCVQSR